MAYRMAFFGDDFTGSTDALETLEEMGVATILFTDVPSAAQLRAHAGKQAIGIAGMSRAMPTAEIGPYLRTAFEHIRELEPAHVHYKVCSTFDSSPAVGSIGKAIDVGSSVFGAAPIPLVVGAPHLGRYCVFGNLFARMGTAANGAVFRLDRHPSMSKHPVTPADESDLSLHLARQTDKKIGLVDVNDLGKPLASVARTVNAKVARGDEVVLFDTLTTGHLLKIGRIIDAMAEKRGKPVFSVGSSAVSNALCAAWVKDGSAAPRTDWPELKTMGPLLVMSGSCSPVTAKQIEWALRHGFAHIPVDATTPASDAIQSLRAGKSVIVHTGTVSGDGRVRITTKGTAGHYGEALARIADEVLSRFSVAGLIVAGGDTSSLFARAIGIRAVEMVARGVRGAPFCKAHSDRPHIDGLIVAFKGGQVGDVDYFTDMQGRIAPNQTKDRT